MPPQGLEFTKGPFQNVPYLIEQTSLLYDQQIIPKGGPTMFQAAAERCIDHRGWRPSLPLFEQNLEPVLRELGVFYVPKQLAPGPGFVFPKLDTTRSPASGKFNPFGWKLLINNTPAKYALLGLGFEFKGPHWIGNSDHMLKLIIEKRTVALVEGPWDLIAARVIAPDAPVLTSETKTLNEMHWAYLKVLGVRNIAFLFDNEVSTKRPDGLGAGALASSGMAEEAKKYGFKTSLLRCPAQDPSKALLRKESAITMKNMLRLATGILN